MFVYQKIGRNTYKIIIFPISRNKILFALQIFGTVVTMRPREIENCCNIEIVNVYIF